MKNTIIKIIVIACLFSGIACSSDTDSTPSDFYVKKMRLIPSPSSTGNPETITFNYDSQNRIANYTVEKTSETITRTIIYNANSVITQINESSTASTNQIQYAFTYSADKIASLSVTSTTSPTPSVINFTYNATLKRYTGTASPGGSLIFQIDVDDANNISRLNFVGDVTTISHTTNAGVFKNNTNSIPLLLTTLFSGGTTKFTVQFFSSKELATMGSPSTTLTATTVRNANNQIGSIEYFNGPSSIIEIEMTYEERN